MIRQRRPGRRLGADIDQRVGGARRFAQNRREDLAVEAASDLFIPIERADVAWRELPEHAMHASPRIAHDARRAAGHEEQAMASEPGATQRARARTALRHGAPVHVGSVSEIKRHRALPRAGSGKADLITKPGEGARAPGESSGISGLCRTARRKGAAENVKSRQTGNSSQDQGLDEFKIFVRAGFLGAGHLVLDRKRRDFVTRRRPRQKR